MSYCGSKGTIMEASDLSGTHKTCYGDVKHIASGKQYQKLYALIF